MKHSEFEIGKTFFASAGFEWLCTDKGTRTITAIMLAPDLDKSWFKGPPYAVEETVFDEYDMKSCYTNLETELLERVGDIETSPHPGFDSTHVFKMLGKETRSNYPRKAVYKNLRKGPDGAIYHGYSAERDEKFGWHILAFEIFTQTYHKIPENEFVLYSLAVDSDLWQRRKDVGFVNLWTPLNTV